MLCIDKRVRVVSTDGAATIVGGENLLPEGEMLLAIHLTASVVTFGQRGHGFTITNGPLYGLKCDANDARVAGNTSLNNRDYGFELTGSGEVCHTTLPSATAEGLPWKGHSY